MPTSYINILKNRNAVLVHCSSLCTLVGDSITPSLGPIEKISKVIRVNYDISCSTISKGDNLNDNYTGALGVILGPKLSTSITQATATDSGTTPCLRKELRKQGTFATTKEFENAINNRVKKITMK